MTTTRITIDWLRDHDACWNDPTPEQAAILAEIPDDGIPLIDVLRDDRIPGEDRIWVATRALPVTTVRRWLGVVVRRALGRVASPDARSLAVLPYLDRGEPVPPDVRRDAHVVRYWYAAYAHDAYAAYAAAAAAAYDAAYAASAAAAAAAAAAYDAAYAASAAAAAAAAASATSAAANYAASRDTERDQQIADLIRIMGETR